MNAASLAGWLLVPVMADKPPKPSDVTAGWVAFGVFLGLALAVLLLWLSFRKQLKKIDFDEEQTVRPRRGSRRDDRHDDGAGGHSRGASR